jgi:hypothetical protein
MEKTDKEKTMKLWLWLVNAGLFSQPFTDTELHCVSANFQIYPTTAYVWKNL